MRIFIIELQKVILLVCTLGILCQLAHKLLFLLHFDSDSSINT